MEKISLKATERVILGKKVKRLRLEGLIPAHVFGNTEENEQISVKIDDFLKVFSQAGETGLIELKIGEEKQRPVLIREVQYHVVKGTPLHIDFYQVNLKEKVTVPVPIVLIGEEPESVHLGETVVLQTLSEVEVEALPTDLIENIEVNISVLKNVDDVITVGQLNYDRTTLTVLADPEEIVVKLDNAVTDEMKALLEEQEAEATAAQEANAETEEGETAEGEETDDTEGAEGASEGDEGKESSDSDSEDKSE